MARSSNSAAQRAKAGSGISSASAPAAHATSESISIERGLSSARAAELQERFGRNVVESPGGRAWRQALREVFREPMFVLLLCASAVYFVLGDALEALVLLGFVLAIVALTVVQSHRTATVLASLRELSAPRAQVLRDGERHLISAADLVPGDLVFINEGARIPADGTVIDSHDLSVDESLLTGESEAIAKSASVGQLYFGSMVVQGQGLMSVTATGANSTLGRIGSSLAAIVQTPSPLQAQAGSFVARFSSLALLLCLMLVALYRWRYGDWLSGVLAGITLAMGILPEEIPVIMTVFMALGARRIANEGVLTRRMNAIETLGQTSVLCVDKTGTLTQNKMSVRALYSGERQQLIDEATSHIDETQHELLEYLVLASEVDPFDPMERAFHETGNRCLANTEHLHADWSLLHEYSLSPELPAMSHGWQAPRLDHRPVACKGAPEAICALCHLDDDQIREILSRAGQLASGGLRVLGVAKARHYGVDWPPLQHDFDFSFVGLVGLADPVRPEAAEAIAECRAAGIRVVMITGDYPSTARAIAAEVGIGSDQIMTGDDLAACDNEQFRRAIAEIDIFARVRPEQKLRLIEAFKACGEVVAMTGDGVNDAPALKAAHIGIAMGRRGTELAREVAALVLLRDDFSPIVAAIRLGRRIYDNLVQALSYTVAVHIPMVAAAMVPVILGWPAMLAPLHIVFLELIINPVCSLVFENEPERRGLMKMPPHRIEHDLLSHPALIRSGAAGLVLAVIVLGIYSATIETGHDVSLARTFAFLVLVGGNVALIFVVRLIASRNVFRRDGVANNYISVVLALTGTALLSLMIVPALAQLFSLVPLLAAEAFK